MPLAPIIRMYIHEMVEISALPIGAADTAPVDTAAAPGAMSSRPAVASAMSAAVSAMPVA